MNIFSIDDIATRAHDDFVAGKYNSTCLVGEPVFFFEAYEADRPGHIYSHEGMAEYKISRMCEYHFDNLFRDQNEQD